MIYKNGVLISQGNQSGHGGEPIQVVSTPHWRLEDWFGELFSNDQYQRFKNYWEHLIQYNKTINLISDSTIRSADEIHFADSIIAFEAFKELNKSPTVYDIGSGNGFPGLIFAMLDPDVNYVLIDKDMRKVEFLKIMIAKLRVSNAEARHMLVEDLPDGSIQSAVSRAYAPLGRSLVQLRSKFASGGLYINLKSDSWAQEVGQLPVQICKYWDQGLVGSYDLPDSKRRYYIIKSTKA